MTIALFAEFTASEGNQDLVTELISGFAALVRAEPGNLAFDPHLRGDHPGTVFVYEAYRDQEAFDMHLTSAHGRAFNQRLGALVVGGGSRLTMLSPISVSAPVNTPSIEELV